jgi:hypothetical protein
MKYLTLFENFNFDELSILSDVKSAIIHIIRIHEQYFYHDTRITDESLFRKDISDIIQLGIIKSNKNINGKNFVDGLYTDQILSIINEYQTGIYHENLFEIGNEWFHTSLRLELDILLDPLKKRDNDIIDTPTFIRLMDKKIEEAMLISKRDVYKKKYKD